MNYPDQVMTNPTPFATVPPLRPFLILSVALFSELSAGMLYWFAALTPGLQFSLALSDPQSLIIIAIANSGSIFGILPGLFHDRFGSRITASVSAAAISLCFLAFLALILLAVPLTSHPVVAWTCFALTFLMSTFSYGLYSSCLTAAVVMFPQRFRGRIVGLCSCMYGASAGVYATIQAAFFPVLAATKGLLLFVAAFSALPCVLAWFVFPDGRHYRLGGGNKDEGVYQAIERVEVLAEPDLEGRMRLAYRLCWGLVICLQIAAVIQVVEFPLFVERICAAAILVAIFSFAILPVRSRVVAREVEGERRGDMVLPPFSTVLMDVRYLYMCLGFFVMIGGGGAALLVQARALVVSRLYESAEAGSKWDDDVVGKSVRTLVLLFAAGNVTSRLIVGEIADWGETNKERLVWKYDILVFDAFLLAFGLLGIAFGHWVVLYISVALIGVSHGTLFSTTPALTTLWFGVQSFPRNFAILGVFLALASASIASTVPAYFREHFGNFVDVPQLADVGRTTRRVCTGLVCSAPAFGFLAALQSIMFLLGRALRPYVRRKAELDVS